MLKITNPRAAFGRNVRYDGGKAVSDQALKAMTFVRECSNLLDIDQQDRTFYNWKRGQARQEEARRTNRLHHRPFI